MDTSKVKGFTDEEMEALEQQEAAENQASFSDDEIDALEVEASGEKYPNWQSALAGAQDTALAGYGPNLLSAAKNRSFSSPEYIAERDRLNAEVKSMQEEDPGSFLAGQVGGGAASLAIPGSAAMKAGSLGARIARAAAVGAAAGAAMDTPDVEGQVTSPLSTEDLKERGKNTTMGAAMGPVAEVGVSTIKAISPDRVNRAITALMPPKSARREMRLAAESGGLTTKENLINFARDEGILKGLPNTEEIYKRALESKEKYGDALSAIYQKSNEVINDQLHSGFGPDNVKYYASMKNMDELKDRVLQEIRAKKWADADKETALEQLGKYFDGLKSEVGLEPDILQLHNMKSAIGSKSFKEGRAELPTSTEEFWRTAGRIVDDEIKKRVDGLATLAGKSSDKNLGQYLREANRRYSLASDIYSIAGDAVDSNSNRIPRDFGAMFGKVIGSPELQVGLSKVGGAIESIPQALKPSGAAVGVNINQILSDATRLPSPNEIYQQRMPTPMPNIERAKILNQQRKMQKQMLGQ